jgi:ubiquinone/menaquinone biosynthesis C-methylase UbiE
VEHLPEPVGKARLVIADPDALRANLLKYTRMAFQLLPPITGPAILDAGCGTGVPTIELARLCDGSILAVDTDGAALEKLLEKIAENRLEGRVRVLRCSFTELPPGEGPFDIVWAEGSVSRLGFSAALAALGRHLKTGGFLVVHDEEGDCLAKVQAAQAGGFEVRGFFVLPASVWWNEYYRHLEAALVEATAARPPFQLEQLREETARFKSKLQSYGSAYFIIKKGEGQ